MVDRGKLFGHVRLAGQVSSQAIGGETFIRVDIPETKTAKAFTRLFGKGAIYSLSPVDEQIARAIAESCAPAPVRPYELPALPAPEPGAVLAPSPVPDPEDIDLVDDDENYHGE